MVARLKRIDEIKTLVNLGVDVFCIDTSLSVKAINENLITDIGLINKAGKSIYLLINKMIHERNLDSLGDLLEIAKKHQVEGIVVGDMTVAIMAEKYGLKDRVIYQPGTFNTHSYDSNYFTNLGIKGITLSKEITLEEMKIIADDKKLEFSLIGHGFIDMFYSRRKLLTNYLIFKGIKHGDIKNNHSFRLKEEERINSSYPIIEDKFGTHIFRDKAQISFNEISILEEFIDDLFIERLFLGDEEYYLAIKAYKNKEHQEKFLSKYENKYSTGFYYQYTEKLKGDLNED